jgi:hypothetical protein
VWVCLLFYFILFFSFKDGTTHNHNLNFDDDTNWFELVAYSRIRKGRKNKKKEGGMLFVDVFHNYVVSDLRETIKITNQETINQKKKQKHIHPI